uniref:Knottin scorpion toxin-like domain-containing protein n=1 Tax=Setaria italica TaxID=4555 RepID=K3ZZJ0_SETIT
MAAKEVAHGHGSFTPQDCRTLPVNPGPCAPASCSQNCRNSIGYGSVGECVSGGCQCTYCAPSKPK